MSDSHFEDIKQERLKKDLEDDEERKRKQEEAELEKAEKEAKKKAKARVSSTPSPEEMRKALERRTLAMLQLKRLAQEAKDAGKIADKHVFTTFSTGGSGYNDNYECKRVSRSAKSAVALWALERRYPVAIRVSDNPIAPVFLVAGDQKELISVLKKFMMAYVIMDSFVLESYWRSGNL